LEEGGPQRRGEPSSGLCLLRLLIAVLVPVLAFAWLRGEKTVTLQVDGQPQRLQTHARTVGELLARAGITVDPRDLLVPGRSNALADGMAVEFVDAREVTVVQDGRQQRLIVPALRAEDVVAALKARGGNHELVSPAPLAPVHDGMVLEVSVPISVTVIADGQKREVVISEGATVAELLGQIGLTLGDDDRIKPTADTPLRTGAEVVIRRVRRTVEARQVAVPPPVIMRETADLPSGTRRVVSPGREGRLNVVETVTLVDGIEESRVRDQEEMVIAPQTRIVEIGTARLPDPSATRAPKLPPFNPARIQTGMASWYDFGDGFTAAHRTLPKGTMVMVTNLANGKSVRVRINDRGPFIKGRIIDLNRPAFAVLATTSEGVIDVRVTW
jgi:resuscitation-promoting factor RpfB